MHGILCLNRNIGGGGCGGSGEQSAETGTLKAAAVSADMDKERKRIRYEKLLRVGLIAEEAGILDSYNENDLYLLFVMNREYLCQHGKAAASGGLPP